MFKIDKGIPISTQLRKKVGKHNTKPMPPRIGNDLRIIPVLNVDDVIVLVGTFTNQGKRITDYGSRTGKRFSLRLVKDTDLLRVWRIS